MRAFGASIAPYLLTRRDMTNNQTAGFFDIDTPELFFALLERKHRDLRGTTKDTADLMLLVMGLNHLREWIAPNYKPRKNDLLQPKPSALPEIFSWSIDQLPEFKTLRSLCNHNKHIKNSLTTKLKTQYGAPLMSWESLGAVSRLGNGPPTDYFVDDQSVLDAIEIVLNYYRTEWFDRTP